MDKMAYGIRFVACSIIPLCLVLWIFCCYTKVVRAEDYKSKTSVTMNSPSLKEMPAGLHYEKRMIDRHIIHVLTIDPKLYRIELVKAHNQAFGRETVAEMANRKGAIAAINAGFFEIGGSQDGFPSGTLVVNGDIFTMFKKEQSFLAWDADKIFVRRAKTNIDLLIGGQSLNIDGINQFSSGNSRILYNQNWGSTTLTPHAQNEVIIGEDQRIVEVRHQGDSKIPINGWVLSLPDKSIPSFFKVGEKVELRINFSNASENKASNYSLESIAYLVRGIPILVDEGQIDPNLKKDKNLDNLPYARSVLGVKENGQLVLVVVEHEYTQDLRQVTLAQVQAILKQQGYSKLRLSILTLPELRKIVEGHLVRNSSVIGFNLPDLAQLMIDLGCQQAINLDGGGSSSMYLQGQVVNTAIGDEDEAMGQKIVRPVSDAIVVMRR